MARSVVNAAAIKRRREQLYPAPGSRAAFCAAADISMAYSKYIEAGTHQPSRRIARDIARALQWDVEQLYATEDGQAAA
jgi:DNA-binding XRE family transcriptional regulator